MQKIVNGRDLVVLVRVQTLLSLLLFVTVLLEHAHYGVLQRYLVLSNDESEVSNYGLVILCKPLMFHNFRYRVALLGLDVQNFGDQILAVSGDVVRVLEVTVHDFLVQGICVGVFEGEVAAHHGKQNNTATPDVDFCTVVLFARYHLWSGVTRRSASRFQSLFRLVRIAEAKVDDFDLAVMIKQQILRLHVPMNYTELMKIVDS